MKEFKEQVLSDLISRVKNDSLAINVDDYEGPIDALKAIIRNIENEKEDFDSLNDFDTLFFDFDACEMTYNNTTIDFDKIKVENFRIILPEKYKEFEDSVNDFFDDEIETEYFNEDGEYGFETVKIYNQDENEVVALRKNEVVYLDNELIDEMYNF